jgi:Sigma-70 region 2
MNETHGGRTAEREAEVISLAPRAYSLARRPLQNDADAEDVTQDVLLQALRKPDTFRGDDALSTGYTRSRSTPRWRTAGAARPAPPAWRQPRATASSSSRAVNCRRCRCPSAAGRASKRRCGRRGEMGRSLRVVRASERAA